MGEISFVPTKSLLSYNESRSPNKFFHMSIRHLISKHLSVNKHKTVHTIYPFMSSDHTFQGEVSRGRFNNILVAEICTSYGGAGFQNWQGPYEGMGSDPWGSLAGTKKTLGSNIGCPHSPTWEFYVISSAFHFFIYKAGLIKKKKKKLPIFKIAVGTKGNNAYNVHSVK